MATRTEPSLNLENISWITKSLRRTNKSDGFRRVQVKLNEIEGLVRYSEPLVQAHFFLLRGAVFIKSVSLNEYGWLRSSVDTILQDSLVHLAESDRACTVVAEESGWTATLSGLQQQCAYESCVAASLLRRLGCQPDIVFDTSRLDPPQHRWVVDAFRNRQALRSGF